MLSPEPWEYAFERELEAAIETRRENVANGAATDFPHYKQLCGEISGIQFCMDELIRIRKRLTNPDDDADLRTE